MNVFSRLKNLFIKTHNPEDTMKKLLIVGLGNIGEEYHNTRHNIGFKIVDELAKDKEVKFETVKLGDRCEFRHKGKKFIMLKPSTYMNLSGKAIKYWMQQEKISIDHLLVVTDDINIDFGTIRIKAKGSDGGHNGMKDIQEKLGTTKYPRFRFGVGNGFSKGKQVDYVLGKWSADEESQLIERIPVTTNAILSFGTDGLTNTMNNYNGK
jgi:peptidyl-tRNA hydrolase, PTH1 family